MKLSEKIKLLRTSKNMTQPELATKAGIEQSYLSKLENDKGTPSYEIIHRIAQAFGMSGMELINSLSQSYIENNLAHIPEVAAEYASIKKQQEKRLKFRFIMASLVVILGVGLFFMGNNAILIPDTEYIYKSKGVIKDNENIYQFQTFNISDIAETNEELAARKKANRSRIDVKEITFQRNRGKSFIDNVDGGRRLYEYQTMVRTNPVANDMISLLGMLLIVTGGFMFLFAFKFKAT
jgi:transcriptional regulator with XRE-family HTH domain